jgi:hypothetical protein
MGSSEDTASLHPVPAQDLNSGLLNGNFTSFSIPTIALLLKLAKRKDLGAGWSLTFSDEIENVCPIFCCVAVIMTRDPV